MNRSATRAPAREQRGAHRTACPVRAATHTSARRDVLRRALASWSSAAPCQLPPPHPPPPPQEDPPPQDELLPQEELLLQDEPLLPHDEPPCDEPPCDEPRSSCEEEWDEPLSPTPAAPSTHQLLSLVLDEPLSPRPPVRWALRWSRPPR
ncbi:hypothetical protein, partial [Streptomyces scabiei]|uniref:hypothetical protein n=1 Tax=Streptomyces scabiei TaxID=1930 RepID=UPI003987DA61